MAHHCIVAAKLPSKGKAVGDVYYTNDSHQTYLVVADLSLLNLSDVLRGAFPHARMDALEAKVDALVGMNKHAKEYLEWLKARAAARLQGESK